ncbi:MAG: CDP-alcohol phosphatidyltransferase family protein [Pseudomonadota bacterium]|nr:CDP-alcohol phosphatidyltransferase family protein [Pseudomonadota bacterium]
MANLITLSRLLLLLALVLLLHSPPTWWQLFNLPLLILIFVSDGLDGYVARKKNQSTLFGALFDIAADRIVENVLWVVLAVLGYAPVWVPILFIVRGAIVDAIRSHDASEGIAPFAGTRSLMMQTLVSGRSMRIGYAVLKATTFGYLVLFMPLQWLNFPGWTTHGPLIHTLANWLIGSTVALNLVRGLPVVVDFLLRGRNGAAPGATNP